ncbi:MAG: type II toxin-antitoxin system HipA family toxin [Alphaproteobacteria bacterium]|nr:type II toxin-antitoxin system HipA family toxin [Alphaproteobacteria bacterium]
MADVSVLEVLLYGEAIGTLTRVAGDRTLFAFNEAYIADDDRPTLGLRFKSEFGELISDFKPVQNKVMPFFSNLLPEGPLRKYLAERADVNPDREFFLLWVLGRDLPGAVAIRPADGEAWPKGMTKEDNGAAGTQARRDNALRFSLAGVQLKFSAATDAKGGLTIPAAGSGGTAIVKLPSQTYPGVPENEFSMMTLARSIGINVPPIDLVDVDSITNLPEGIEKIGPKAFVIERFDRLPDGQLIHIEDFAQVFDVYAQDKYKTANMRNIASVIAAESDDEDIAELVRRMTFNTLIGNGDMHLKNWSLIYPDRRNAALAPAYDFVSTIPYIPNDQAALNVSRSKPFDSFSADELCHFAAKTAIAEKLVLDTARETVARFRESWESEKHHLPMSKEVITAIDQLLPRIPIANE